MEFRRVAAPYISNTALLVEKSRRDDHTIFYRMGSVDRVSTGTLNLIEAPWTSGLGANPFKDFFTQSRDLAGYISYEAGYAFEDRWASLAVPEHGYILRFMEVDCWYEADHETRQASFVLSESADPEAQLSLKRLITGINDSTPSIPDLIVLPDHILALMGELNQGQYSAKVQQVLADIQSGRYYELNLTQRFNSVSPRPPEVVFSELLHRMNPSRAFYGNFGDEVICSCSPEIFLCKSGEEISTYPVKGSMLGQQAPDSNDKLFAEHTMVVDLARNDLGRISDKAWVTVSDFAVVKTFGEISHMESKVNGSTSLRWPQILPAVYPAASISGAPKVEVVQAINQYEISRRGVYTGSCGWISANGDLDLNVAIRTLVAVPEGEYWRYQVGSGGAIVADSDPEEEYQECLNKVRPLLSTL